MISKFCLICTIECNEHKSLVTQANAEAQLNYAKTQLEGSIRALKAEVAKSVTENPALDESVFKYETVLGKISNFNLQEVIITDKGNLANEPFPKSWSF